MAEYIRMWYIIPVWPNILFEVKIFMVSPSLWKKYLTFINIPHVHPMRMHSMMYLMILICVVDVDVFPIILVRL